ncbi:hypothetical protein CDAR_51101 [Caerostris darwini]|uniref:Uncharacterized protein n=1 Tax=Caerostris darwini TaxID=1538125 RepID=A0AAV4U5W7_9ARAC|nr:hypothetical protein CDAR_51101 [Caerostris darwini]
MRKNPADTYNTGIFRPLQPIKKLGARPSTRISFEKTLFHAFLKPRPPQFWPQDKLTPCPIAFQFVIMPLSSRWGCFFFTLSLGALLIEVVKRGVVVCFNLE